MFMFRRHSRRRASGSLRQRIVSLKPAFRKGAMSSLGHKRTFWRKANISAACVMSAKCQRTFVNLFDYLVRSWRISSSQGDRNSHQRDADDHHYKARWPGPKAGMSANITPQKNSDTTAMTLETRSAVCAFSKTTKGITTGRLTG